MPPEYAYNLYGYPLQEENERQLKIYKNASKRKHKRYVVTETAKIRILCALFALLALTVMIRYAVINDLTTQNRIMSETLKSLTAENQQAVVYINSTTDLCAVERVATEQLDMKKPDGNQVVRLSLDMSNRTVKPQKTQSNFAKGTKKVIAFAMEYLYWGITIITSVNLR